VYCRIWDEECAITRYRRAAYALYLTINQVWSV
jgi:hypothetical protein